MGTSKAAGRPVAIVTGGGSGIGFCLARRLAEQGYAVVLAGRDKARLLQAAGQIAAGQKPGRQAAGTQGAKAGPNRKTIETFSCDLSRPDECLRLYEAFRNRPVAVLVNAAGFGVYGAFDASDTAGEQQMLAVHCQAVHLLMKLFLPDMKRRGRGAILNVASLAGLTPGGPYMAAYYATKAYVASLTRGVAEELRAERSPVYVGALCPGPVATPFFARAGIRAAVRGADPDTVARAALQGMSRRKDVIVPGAGSRIACLAAKLLPARLTLLINRQIQARKRKAG